MKATPPHGRARFDAMARTTRKHISNHEIADQFARLANLLEIEGANPFRVRAYRNAAEMIDGYQREMADLVEEGENLSRLPTIGADLAGKIVTLVETGRLPILNTVEARTPPALNELLRVEGLGPRRVKALYEQLGIRSLADLTRAAEQGRLQQLRGFGEKMEAAILRRVKRAAKRGRRVNRVHAEPIALRLVEFLRKSSGVKRVEIAGSFRRGRDTVGDLDILVTAARGSDILDRFVSYPAVREVMSQGDTRSSVRLKSGLQVDLRVVPQVSYGAALYYFTGSKSHNIELRKRAVRRGLKINEYGVFRGDERIAGRTEKEVAAAVGLPLIAPELRESHGEIEAALAGRLPDLIELKDIRGDLHCHSKASDGRDTIAVMARAAAKLGYRFIAITDHTRRVSVANGLDEIRLRKQCDEIDCLNERLDGIVVLKSAEVDVLKDGSLDLDDAILERLDIVTAAVHYHFDLSRNAQTRRIAQAVSHPLVSVLAHPSGRLINEREPYDADLAEIMQVAKKHDCALEVNAQPARLDLDDEGCRLARETGVAIAIGTDAHCRADLGNMRHGIVQARRGWLEAPQVINTWSLRSLRRFVGRG